MNYPTPETALVGIAMHGGNVLDDIDLTGADFASPGLGALWDQMLRLHHDGQPTDPTTLVALLPQLGYRDITPLDITSWYGDAPAGGGAHYARLIADAATRARMRMAAKRIEQLADGETPVQDAVEIARAEVDNTSRSVAETGLLADTIADTIEALDKPAVMYASGWADLDHLIGGWRPGALYVVGARPGAGKTILGVQAAIGLAAHGGVALNSLEMSRREVHERILANMAGVPLVALKNRTLDQTHWQLVTNALPKIQDMPMSIDDRSAVSANDIRSHARTLARRGPLAGVVVDYLQLMSPPRGDRRARHEVVAEMSRSLKILARDLEVPVIALSQLNRGSEGRADRRPTLSDLRESGALEQDSDVVLLLHVEDEDPATLHVSVAKNRHGPPGHLKLARRGVYARLDNHAWTPRGGETA